MLDMRRPKNVCELTLIDDPFTLRTAIFQNVGPERA